MKGSLLLTFDELNDGNNSSNVDVFVNSQLRYRLYLDSTNLYSTYVDIGDVVTITMNNFIDGIQINVYRTDYTTDDTNGDNGIKITSITGNTGTTGSVTFTVSKLDSSYGYAYNINFINFTITPTPTPTVTPSLTPTNTPTVTPTPSPTPPAIVFDGQFVLTADAVNQLLLSQDYGQTFSTTYTSSGGFFGACLSYNAQFMYASTATRVIKSDNYGVSWNIVFTSSSLFGIDCDDTGQYILVAANGGCYKSDDYGNSWTFVSGGTGTYQYNLTVVPAKNIFPQYAFPRLSTQYIKILTGSTSNILYDFTNLPQDEWREFVISDDMKYYLVVESDGDASGNAYLSTDSGNTFSIVTSVGSNLSQPEVAMSSNGQYMYISSDTEGRLYYSYDYGNTWNFYTRPTSISDVDCSSNGRFIYTSYEGGNVNNILFSWDYGTNWYTSNQTNSNRFVRCNKNSILPPAITPTPTPSITATNTPTPSITPTLSLTATASPTPTVTPTLTKTPTKTPTPTPTLTPTPTQPGTINQNQLQIFADLQRNGSYDGTGTTWNDLSGNGFNGTLYNGVIYQTGNTNAFILDGVNDYIQFPTGSTLLDTNSFTFSVWVSGITEDTSQVFICRGGGGPTNDWSLRLELDTSLTGDPIRAGVVADGTAYFANDPAGNTYNKNDWYYLTLQWSNNTGIIINDFIRLYINGVLRAQTDCGKRTSIRTSVSGWNIGRYYSSGFYYYPFAIGEFDMYNRSLSDVEILSNFNILKYKYGY